MPILFTRNVSTLIMTVLGHEVAVCGYHLYGSEVQDAGGVRVYDNGAQILLLAYSIADIEDDGYTARTFTVAGIQFKLSVTGYGEYKISLVDQVNMPISIPTLADNIMSIDSFKNVADGYTSFVYTATIGSMSVQ